MKKLTLFASAFLLSLGSYAQQALWRGTNIVSPQINEDNTVTFRIHAPKASKVEIEGDFLPPTKVDTPFGPQDIPSSSRKERMEYGNILLQYCPANFTVILCM